MGSKISRRYIQVVDIRVAGLRQERTRRAIIAAATPAVQLFSSTVLGEKMGGEIPRYCFIRSLYYKLSFFLASKRP
jgi:hypothetical protein